MGIPGPIPPIPPSPEPNLLVSTSVEQPPETVMSELAAMDAGMELADAAVVGVSAAPMEEDEAQGGSIPEHSNIPQGVEDMEGLDSSELLNIHSPSGQVRTIDPVLEIFVSVGLKPTHKRNG